MNAFNVFLKPVFYLDPGSGSILIQIIVATILGGLIAVRVFWRRLISRFKHGSGGTEKTGELDTHDEGSQ